MRKLQISESLQRRMSRLGVDPDKLEERFVRSSGPGGQNVNKVATCVQLFDPLHDIRIECREERAQWKNRVRARELLCEALEQRRREEKAAADKARHQKRARNRKPSKKEKEKRLEGKRRNKEKKQLRGKVRRKDYD